MDKNEARLKKLSIQLRKFCGNDGREQNLRKCAEIFYQLGQEYEKLSENSVDKHDQKISLIRSAVLFNAAAVRRSKNVNMIKQDLAKLCRKALTLAKAKFMDSDLLELSQEVFLRVSSLRTDVNCSMDKEKTSVNMPWSEKVKITESRQNFITTEYKFIMSDIIEHTILTLGTPQCRFALIGMGSLARHEITPYSDFEHAYILEDNVQERVDYEEILEYFRWVSVIFHLIVINFGETIVANVSLPHINDQVCTENDWFFDENTPRGISFDGMMPHASKFPLGRSETKSKQWKTELIKPVSEMLQYLEAEESLKNGYRLAEVLQNSCFVCGSEPVYTSYKKGIATLLQSNGLTNVIAGLNEDFQNFNPLNTLPNLHTKQQFNVKRLIYRSTSLFVAALGHIYKIPAQSSFEIIRKLCEANFISQSFKENTLFALSLTCDVRLRVYMQQNGQYDLVNVRQNNDESFTSTLIGMLGENIVVNYFETVLQLQSLVQQSCHNVQEPQDLDIFNRLFILYWFKLYDSAIKECRTLLKELHLEDETGRIFCLHTMFYSYVYLKEYSEATEIYECMQIYPGCCVSPDVAALAYHEAAQHASSDHNLNYYLGQEVVLRKLLLTETKSPAKKQLLLHRIGECLFECRKYQEAFKYFRQENNFIQIWRDRFDKLQPIRCQIKIAKCSYFLGKLSVAMSFYDIALLHLTRLQQKDCDNKSVLDMIATCHNGIGNLFLKNKDVQCVDHFDKACDIWIKLQSENLNDLVLSLSFAGKQLLQGQEYAHVITCFKMELKIREHRPTDWNNLNVKADRYFALGCCFHKLNDTDQALKYLTKAKEILQLINDEKAPLDIAKCDAMLSSTYLDAKNYQCAFSHSQAGLETLPDNEVNFLVRCYFTKAQCLFYFGKTLEASDAFERSKELSTIKKM